MSLNMIVVAVICIVIIVVVLILMTGKIKIFSKTSAACESKGAGAHCIAEGASCDGPVHRIGTDCGSRETNTPHCCVPIGGSSAPAEPAETKKAPATT